MTRHCGTLENVSGSGVSLPGMRLRGREAKSDFQGCCKGVSGWKSGCGASAGGYMTVGRKLAANKNSWNGTDRHPGWGRGVSSPRSSVSHLSPAPSFGTLNSQSVPQTPILPSDLHGCGRSSESRCNRSVLRCSSLSGSWCACHRSAQNSRANRNPRRSVIQGIVHRRRHT